MRVAWHLGRAALVFWVGAILLPNAVVDATSSTVQHRSPQAALALQGVSSSADSGRDGARRLTDEVQAAEDDVRRIVARLRLETERFIERLP